MSTAEEIWKKVLSLMESDLTSTTLNTWFDDTQAVALESDRLVLYTPTDFKKNIIASRYVPNIQKALKELFSSELHVTVLGEGELESYAKNAGDFLPGTEAYTFDTFVVGSSNRMAWSAAKAVADAPGKGFNPLFLYGGPGLGKTHLLYAIAHAVHAAHPEYKVVYIKGETFTNELIAAIQAHKNQEFRDKYRSANVFLMDDVQFIAGRPASQEEMFHTFNSLYETGSQIVFTADRPPVEMLRLDERLRSRFQSGLPIDIQPPDYETRVAIIKNKAIARGMNLSEPVLNAIAENITSNVRVIEGTVNKILAFQELLGQPVEDVNTVIKAIETMVKNTQDFMPSVDDIIEEVGKFYAFDAQEIKGPSRTKDIVLARQVAMYISRQLTTLPLKDIGKVFNGRDHTTTLHSVSRIEKMIKESPELSEVIKDITANINSRYE